MNESDIREKWLNIAYSEKKQAPRAHGAYLAGNKGIGRFSCDRLGEHLLMFTRKKGGPLLSLEIDWPKFEVEGNRDLTIQSIGISLSVVTDAQCKRVVGSKMPTTGTVLVITKLRSVWDRGRLLEVKRTLEKFLNPNQLFLRDQFTIELLAPDLKRHDGRAYADQVNGVVQNRIFKALRFNTTFIESAIDEAGEYVDTVLWHEGEQVIRLREKNVDYRDLRNVRVFIYYLNSYKKAYFKRQTGIRAIDFGSIFLFLNGFRVAPYGDRGDDWLGLDVRKTQGTTRYLGSRDLIGRIEVIDAEESFKPISSREGLKKTPAFNQLREGYFLEVLRRLERFVVEGLGWDSIPDSLRDAVRAEDGLDWQRTAEQYSESWDRKKDRIAMTIMSYAGTSEERLVKFWFNPSLLENIYERRAEDFKHILGQIDAFEPDQLEPDLKRHLKRFSGLLAKKEAEAANAREEAAALRISLTEQKRQVGRLVEEKDTYHAQTLFLKSISTLDAKHLLTFHHQIALDSSIVENYVGRAIKTIKDIPDARPILQYLDKIGLANKRIMATAQFATKANFKAGSRKESTDIPAFIEQYTLNVARDFIATSIKLDVMNSVSESFETKASRIELSMLVDSIISNASKAHAKKLSIQIKKVAANVLRISFVDDGRGVASSVSNLDDLFELGFTTTSGSGLGLYHCRQIVESLGGVIKAVPAKPNGLEIRVELTR